MATRPCMMMTAKPTPSTAPADYQDRSFDAPTAESAADGSRQARRAPPALAPGPIHGPVRGSRRSRTQSEARRSRRPGGCRALEKFRARRCTRAGERAWWSIRFAPLGKSCAMRAAIAVSRACACSGETPSRRRTRALKIMLLRRVRTSGSRPAVFIGTNSATPSGQTRRAGRTPTISRGTPPSVTRRPTTLDAPPNCSCQSA